MSQQRATIVVCVLLALAFAMPIWLTSGAVPTQSLFCPADTLVVGSLDPGALLSVGGGFLAMLGLIGISFVFFPTPKRPRPADIVLARRRRIAAIVGGCLVVIAIPMVTKGLASFYCAKPQGIVVHETFLGEGRTYAWADVSKITTHCFRKSLLRSPWYYFDVLMKDGQTFALGEPALIRNYRQLGEALRDVPFTYDNSRTAECSPRLRQLFATRPGSQVNQPVNHPD